MDPKPNNIFLVGPMGSGKTTVGRKVAKNLGLEFFDCDLELEKQTGASLNLIFDIEGETGFRERETRLLEDLTSRRDVVLATGGGTVLSSHNRSLLMKNGFTIWLQTSVEQQLRRLANDKKRPLLQVENRRERLEEMARIRDPLYGETADMVFVSRNRSVRFMAGELTKAIQERFGIRPVEQAHANN